MIDGWSVEREGKPEQQVTSLSYSLFSVSRKVVSEQTRNLATFLLLYPVNKTCIRRKVQKLS